MNKLIKELEVAGLTVPVLKDILSKYEVYDIDMSSIGMSSRDMMSSMVLRSLSCEENVEECSEELMKSSLKLAKKSKKTKSKSLEEDVNNKCLEAFNENSAATGSTPIVVKKKSAEDKAFDKALAKAEALKAKEEAKKAKQEEKAKDIGGYTTEELKAKKAEKAAALKAQKAEEKLKAKEAKAAELKAQKNEKKEAEKAAKAEELKALKNEKKEALKKEKEALKALKKEKKEALKKEKKVDSKKKQEKVVTVVETDEVEEEPDVVKRFEFEGVKYLKSKNTGIIYNMEQDVIGKWNESTQKIDFNTEDGEEEEEDYDN